MITTQKATPGIHAPSLLWCTWQLLRGMNPRHLTIPDADLRGKWVLLTGGNSGIGREASLQFAKWGANIILGCRQPPPHEMHPDVAVEEYKAAALAAGHEGTVIQWWEVDMGSLESVEAFAKRWLAKECALDILANNAGLGGYVGDTKHTIDGFELVHQVNFLSHVYLTMWLLPSLSKARQPRIICTTSNMQYLGTFDLTNTTRGKGAYPNNKLYFQTWLTELQDRMSKHASCEHVVIQGVHPGFVASNIWNLPSNNVKWSERIAGRLSLLFGWFGIDPQQGSLSITHAATAAEAGSNLPELLDGMKLGRGGGRFFNRIWDEVPMPQTKDPECRQMIWDLVSRELKLEEKGLLNDLGT
ncbi:Retinol dehydrogenase 13 [Hyphodiscus hymeniophilus]|uniref:Retinol dehydrogenase 13 n=1 Tax=Hyphodiscus hymeniophilus TaxID=353542 RepID=A0A9P6VDQ5_9HELO|nr:Retinol dehydrogenase 13 [Hyphodiscus hymeniophilus]